jgi:hypothetical protein
MVRVWLRLGIEMPYAIVARPDGTYRVLNKVTGRVLSKSTTLTKARAQIRAVHVNNHTPTPGRKLRPKSKRTPMSTKAGPRRGRKKL